MSEAEGTVGNKRTSHRKCRSVLSVIGTEIIRATKNHGLDLQRAKSVSEKVVCRLAEQFGGRQIYISAHRRNALIKRDRLIRSRYNGRNGHELCRRYDISRTRLYQILKSPEV